MANEEQISILKQGVEVWNKWREEHFDIEIDLTLSVLVKAKLRGADLRRVDLSGAYLFEADLRGADLTGANLIAANLKGANLANAKLIAADLSQTNLSEVNLGKADLAQAALINSNLWGVSFVGSKLADAMLHSAIFGRSDLSKAVGLDSIYHSAPSSISTDSFVASKGKVPDEFLRGCGLSDWEIESVKLYDPDLTNEERNKVLYKIFDLQANQALQITPLFISYSHADGLFVDKIGEHLTEKGIRYWRDVHNLKAGRIEMQIDIGIRQNPTVLLVLSEHSLRSDWVEHEVRTARDVEKELGRYVLCPVTLDDSWKSSRWPKRVMEQIMEYNILDFSAWENDSKFDEMFRKLIDGLELFYKG